MKLVFCSLHQTASMTVLPKTATSFILLVFRNKIIYQDFSLISSAGTTDFNDPQRW